MAFLLALPLGLVGLYIRLRLEETPDFRAVQRHGGLSTTPLAETLRTSRRRVLIGFGVVATVSLTFNVFFVFLPNFVATTGRVPLPRALAGALLGLLFASVLAPVFGRLTDRVGRRPVVAAGVLALMVLTVPAYWLIERGSSSQVVIGYLAIGVGLGAVGLSTFLAELFPTRLRYSGLSNALLPAWYATGVGVVAFGCALLAPETAPGARSASRLGQAPSASSRRDIRAPGASETT